MNALDRGRSEEERREKPEPTGAFLALAIDTLTHRNGCRANRTSAKEHV